MQSCLIFIWPLGPCWVWFVRGAELLIQSFLFECQINFMNHKTLPDCSLMMAHYTLALCVNCWVRDNPCTFHLPPSGSIFVFVWHVHFDNSISIWLLLSAVSCRQSVNTIIPLPPHSTLYVIFSQETFHDGSLSKTNKTPFYSEFKNLTHISGECASFLCFQDFIL